MAKSRRTTLAASNGLMQADVVTVGLPLLIGGKEHSTGPGTSHFDIRKELDDTLLNCSFLDDHQFFAGQTKGIFFDAVRGGVLSEPFQPDDNGVQKTQPVTVLQK